MFVTAAGADRDAASVSKVVLTAAATARTCHNTGHLKALCPLCAKMKSSPKHGLWCLSAGLRPDCLGSQEVRLQEMLKQHGLSPVVAEVEEETVHCALGVCGPLPGFLERYRLGGCRGRSSGLLHPALDLSQCVSSSLEYLCKE